ncbi:MaoC family dehydratase [Azoarcus sp. TTM-91]|uniref:MaoC family dehydratase n=1 Tax=Azoarcus sp. TTM-91 TaxID=2691581 RepID=UPI00145E23C9|nr:MaoC family dehydratase [Azoarcus sp. TTM-91]NMG36955.1 MaoC family dehydratase [Azoarcus sp. TTM-91]
MEIAHFASPAALEAAVGRRVATGAWIVMDQPRINGFAETTGDRQWIHVDTARAEKESPFGGTIAHGFLVISAAAASMLDVVVVEQAGMAVIYGLDKVRFVSPVPQGSRIRAAIGLQALEPRGEGMQARWEVTVEREGGDKPAAVFELVVRYYPAA